MARRVMTRPRDAVRNRMSHVDSARVRQLTRRMALLPQTARTAVNAADNRKASTPSTEGMKEAAGEFVDDKEAVSGFVQRNAVSGFVQRKAVSGFVQRNATGGFARLATGETR